MDYTLKENKKTTTLGGKLILKQFLAYKKQVAIIVAMLSIATVATTVSPLIIRRAIDVDIAAKSVTGLLYTVGILAICILISFTARFIQMRMTGALGQEILFSIRSQVFTKLQSLPLKFFSQNQTGDIIQRLTGNVDSINNFFSEGIMRLLGMVFGLIAQSIFMFWADWRIGLIATAGGIAIIIFLRIQGIYLERAIKQSLKIEGQGSAYIQESLNGFRSIVQYNQAETFKKKIIDKNLEFLKATYKAGAISATSESFLGLISLTATIIILFQSLSFYAAGNMTQGTVILFLAYSVTYFRQLGGISDLWLIIQRGIASASRIAELLQLQNDLHSKEEAYVPEKGKIEGKVEFRNVEFSYGSKTPVLKNLSFCVEKGQSIAIIGPTGAGKTTFVNLIARLYDVDKGSILVDDIDVRDWNIDELRKSIGYLIQDTFLFEDTILNNIRYNNQEVTKQQAVEMFEYLGAKDFLVSLPEGIDTKLESGGENISAGQRQVIALVRVLLRDPRILILDEATSRIDTKSEKMIQKAIEKANVGRTSFIIAHRLSTIFNADQIVLVQDNQILEQGTHDELIARKGVYFELYSKFVGN